MRGQREVIDKLNAILADELTAISQYMVHAEVCENYGYQRLHDYTKARAIAEMKHAEAIVARIIFLEYSPVVDHLNPLHIAVDVEQMLKNDQAAELVAISGYNDALQLCIRLGDGGSHEIAQDNLEDEEDHLDWIQAQLAQISQMGIGIYLQQQIRPEAG